MFSQKKKWRIRVFIDRGIKDEEIREREREREGMKKIRGG